MKLFFLFSILLIGAAKGQWPPGCGENEAFNFCGSTCEPSCETPNPTLCTEQCLFRCQCNKGYLRRADKKCVLQDQCPQVCPINEYWDKCYNSCTERRCPRNGLFVPPCLPKPCTGGCSCQNGYVRNADGRCVSETDCPSICPINEYWLACYDPCNDKRCPGQSTPPCLGRACFQGFGGCACQDGYVRNSDGRCVREADCPSICPVNEYWIACYDPCNDRRCPGQSTPPCLGRPCIQGFGGCSCQSGYVRNSEGRCVSEDACQPICPPNEYFNECYNSCTEKKCPVWNAPPNICPLFCTRGCSCLDGYVRNDQGQCVRDWECPPSVPPTPPPLSCANILCHWATCAMVYPYDCPNCTPQPRCLRNNDCNRRRCRRYQECVLIESFCRRPPCRPRAVCRPRQIIWPFSERESVGWTSCKDKNCTAPAAVCALVKPVSCGNINKTECPLKPECVKENACATTKCKNGTVCVLHEVFECIKDVCSPIAKCEPIQEKPTTKGTTEGTTEASVHEQPCKENETISYCKTNCSDTNCNEKPVLCKRVCIGMGCVCLDDFFRDKSGKCVTQKECDAEKGKKP